MGRGGRGRGKAPPMRGRPKVKAPPMKRTEQSAGSQFSAMRRTCDANSVERRYLSDGWLGVSCDEQLSLIFFRCIGSFGAMHRR